VKAADVDLLFVPGWGGSDAEHWQSRWEQRLSTGRRIEQADWFFPSLPEAVARIVAAVEAAERPVVLIAHSVGAALVAHTAQALLARGTAGKVAGAFLVAPTKEENAIAHAGLDPAFAPYPLDPLPFPSLLVASRDDALCDFETAGDYALAWGSALVDAGAQGHINVASGHGPWPEGLMRLAGFLAKL